ncbi:hypothetical protein LMG3431_02346 [Achromobacter pestifer]|uniref:Secreted protein n=1 Tax=Achromobacter pestifer TaxID=1353889 RepID=A0A6S6YV22_9BURK|nr:hypothetical protein LMG3431_02346 [Achromobacter pestifer]
MLVSVMTLSAVTVAPLAAASSNLTVTAPGELPASRRIASTLTAAALPLNAPSTLSDSVTERPLTLLM